MLQQETGADGVQRQLVQREELNDAAEGEGPGTPIAAGKAAVGASERGLRAPMGRVVHEAGPKLPQVVAFVLRNLVTAGYSPGLEIEALGAVESLAVTQGLEGDATPGETVRAVTIRSGTAEALMDWLQSEKKLRLVVCEADQDVLRFSNESVGLLIELVKQKRFKLPQWMSNELFREILVRCTPLSVMREFLDASRRFHESANARTAKEVARLFRVAVDPLDLDASVTNAISLDVALSDLPEFVILFETLGDTAALSDFFAFLEQEHPGDDGKSAALQDSSAREELLSRFGRFQRGESLEDGGGKGEGGAGAGTGREGAGAGGGGLAEQWLRSKDLQGVLEGKAPPLRNGSRGEGVRLMQRVLRRWGEKGATPPRDLLAKSGADGAFGSETDKAVREFQDQNGLKSDGAVGPETLRALDEFALADGDVSRGGIIVLPPIPASLVTSPELNPPLFSFALGSELRAQMVFQFGDVFEAFTKFDFAWNRVRVPQKAGLTDLETAPGESISFSEVAKQRLARQLRNAEADEAPWLRAGACSARRSEPPWSSARARRPCVERRARSKSRWCDRPCR